MEKFYPELSAAFSRLLIGLAGRKIAVVGHARPDGDWEQGAKGVDGGAVRLVGTYADHAAR